MFVADGQQLWNVAIWQRESARFAIRAMLRTNLGSRCLNAHFVSVVLEKYVSHLLSEQLLISRPFRSLIVFDNAMDRPKIIEMETERKLYIDCYCKLWWLPLNDFHGIVQDMGDLLLCAGMGNFDK